MRRILLSLSVLAAALLAAEAGLRLRPVSLVTGWLVDTDKGVLDDDLIFIRPHLRDDRTYVLEPGRRALIALGDSFTGSYPVDAGAAYPARLAARLDAAGAGFSVVNAGMGDTGPDQQLRLLELQVLPRIRPDVVVWQMYANDVWDNWAKPTYDIRDGKLAPLDGRRNWLYVRQRIFDLTPLPATLKRESALFRHALKTAEHWMRAQVPARYAGRAEAWALDKLALEIEEMERLGRKLGFRPYYALVAPQALYLDDAGVVWEEAPHIGGLRGFHDGLRRLLAERPGFIPIRLEAPGSEPAWQALFADGHRDKNALGDRHFNEAGYERMAAAIADRLLADAASSAASSPARKTPRRGAPSVPERERVSAPAAGS